ncbi:MAG: DUF502 domain-containing protein [Bacteroidales bacterium]|nr:DUF502 domain-containing protein [Bacteroidales bacterium]
MLKRLIGFFLQGLLYIVPILVTIYVVTYAVSYIDKLISNIPYFSEHVESKGIPGLGAFIIFVFICLVGWLLPIVLSTPIVGLFHKLINSTPLIGVIYSSVKDLMSAFVGKNKKFDSPVIVSIDSGGNVYRLGFITQKDLSKLGLNEMVSVYMPSSYGLLGELVIVPAKNVKPVNGSSAEVMKFIVSGGVATIEEDARTEQH